MPERSKGEDVFVVLADHGSLSMKDLAACFRVCSAWRQELADRNFSYPAVRMCVRLLELGPREAAAMSARISLRRPTPRLCRLDQIRRFLERMRDETRLAAWPIVDRAVVDEVMQEPEGSFLRTEMLAMSWAWLHEKEKVLDSSHEEFYRCIGTGRDPFRGHVVCMAHHPKGSVIATGRGDKIGLWNTASCTPAVMDTLEGHTRGVLCLCYSLGDGTLLASGGGDRVVHIWKAPEGGKATLVHRLRGHTDEVRSVAFSPDGSRLCSGSFDSTINVWDALQGGKPLMTLWGHVRYVCGVAWSGAGHIASGGFDQAVRLWDCVTGAELKKLVGHTDWVRSLAFTPGGQRVASGSMDRTVMVWSVLSGSRIWTLPSHSNLVVSVAAHPNGAILASASWDKEVHVWRMPPHPIPGLKDEDETPKIIAKLKGHGEAVWSICFDAGGDVLASGCRDGSIKLWDPRFRG